MHAQVLQEASDALVGMRHNSHKVQRVVQNVVDTAGCHECTRSLVAWQTSPKHTKPLFYEKHTEICTNCSSVKHTRPVLQLAGQSGYSTQPVSYLLPQKSMLEAIDAMPQIGKLVSSTFRGLSALVRDTTKQ